MRLKRLQGALGRMGGLGVPVQWRRKGVTVVACVLALVTGAGSATAWGAPVPGGAPTPASQIADLVASIADTDQQVADLERAAASRREGVNRSLVDLQSARDAGRLAAVAAGGARDQLSTATAQVRAAQVRFDGLIKDLYRQGSSSSATELLVADDPAALVDRSAVISRITAAQRVVVEDVKRRRNDAANRSAIAAVTVRTARRAVDDVRRQQRAAQQAMDSAVSAIRAQQTRRVSLESDRAAAVVALAKLRPSRPAPPVPGVAKRSTVAGTPQVPASTDAPAGTAPAGRDTIAAVRDAAAKLAANVVQQALAAVVASLTRPHTDINGSQQPDASRTDPAAAGAAPAAPTGPSVDGVPPEATAGPAAVETAVNRAMSQLGVPYSWGGGNASGPTVGVRDGGVADSFGDYNKVGFDCSGLMMYAFAGAGISLPHYSGYQYTAGRQVPLAQMQRGDLIFYGTNASEHESMYLGDGTMIEAPQSGDVVKISPVRTNGAMPYVVRLL